MTTDDTDDLLEPTPLEHQDVYDAAHAHGWAGVPLPDALAVLARDLGPLEDGRLCAAEDGHACGRGDRAQHDAKLTAPATGDDSFPF